MYRLLGLLILGVAIALPTIAMAKKGEKPEKPEKVTIAHCADEMEIEGAMVKYYRVIRVSANALEAHLAHDDFETDEAPGTVFTDPEGFEEWFEDADDGDDDDADGEE